MRMEKLEELIKNEAKRSREDFLYHIDTVVKPEFTHLDKMYSKSNDNYLEFRAETQILNVKFKAQQKKLTEFETNIYSL